MTDYYALSDKHAIRMARDVVAGLGNSTESGHLPPEDYEEPLYDPREVYGVAGSNLKKAYDVRYQSHPQPTATPNILRNTFRDVIARIVDG